MRNVGRICSLFCESDRSCRGFRGGERLSRGGDDDIIVVVKVHNVHTTCRKVNDQKVARIVKESIIVVSSFREGRLVAVVGIGLVWNVKIDWVTETLQIPAKPKNVKKHIRL